MAGLGSPQVTGSLSEFSHSSSDLCTATDDDGWEPYDPSAFEDVRISSMQPSPGPSIPLVAPTALPIVPGVSDPHASHHVTDTPLTSPSIDSTSKTEEAHVSAELDSTPLIPSPDPEPSTNRIAPGLRTSSSANNIAVLAQQSSPLRTTPSTLLPSGGSIRLRSGSFHVTPQEVRNGGNDAREAEPGTPIASRRGSGDRELQRTRSVGDIPRPSFLDSALPPLPSMPFIGDLMTGVCEHSPSQTISSIDLYSSVWIWQGGGIVQNSCP